MTYACSLLLDRHALLTIRNLTPRIIDSNVRYERDYCEENGHLWDAEEAIDKTDSDQRKFEEALDATSLVPRISPLILRERKQLGVRHRGAVFCHHRGDLSLANPGGRRRTQRIFPACTSLRATVAGSADAGRESYFSGRGNASRVPRFSCIF
jgi:hypothetical protein